MQETESFECYVYGLVSSFLSNRNQFVSINNTYSDPSFVTCAISRGSIFGSTSVPVLYISINPDGKLLFYADDSTILFSHKDLA